MAAFVKYENAVQAIAAGTMDIFGTGGAADTLVILLSNTAPDTVNDTALADAAELSTGNGYTSNSHSVTLNGTRSSGTYTAGASDVVITASGGTIGPFRYVILHNSTANLLLGYWDYGSSISLNDGETFTVDVTTSVFTIA